MRKNVTAIVAIGLLVFVAAGFSCSFTTANISKLEFGKNEKADPVTTSFDVGEKIYAVATVSNTSSKQKMNFKVSFENVTGKSKGEEALDQNIDFEGARPVWLSFSVPLPGEYKVEATLSDEDGKKIDSKSGTVKAAGNPVTAAPPIDPKKVDEDDEAK